MSAIFSIQGKRVLLTGGTAGIGQGVARHFVEHGANVIITGRRAQGADIAAEMGARFVAMDATDPAQITASIQTAGELLGGVIDVLILNAGIDLDTGEAHTLDMTSFRRIYEVNVFAVAQCLRDALPYLATGSSVILTSSPAGQVNAPGMGAYSSSKAAVNSLTQSFAAELAPQGIRVNAVLPGLVESEMSSGSTGEVESLRKLTLSGVVRKPVEMAGTFQYLASAASEPVTAAIVAADDGMSASISTQVMAAIFGGDDEET